MRKVLFVPLIALLMAADPDGCASGSGYQYECECWVPAIGPFTVGEPAPCGDTDEDAYKQAVDECSNETGEICECECSTGGKSCDGAGD